MTKVTVENYKDDKYYPKIVRVVEAILAQGDIVAPVDVFVRRQGKAAIEDERPFQLKGNKWKRQFETT